MCVLSGLNFLHYMYWAAKYKYRGRGSANEWRKGEKIEHAALNWIMCSFDCRSESVFKTLIGWSKFWFVNHKNWFVYVTATSTLTPRKFNWCTLSIYIKYCANASNNILLLCHCFKKYILSPPQNKRLFWVNCGN
jgi:hypothetical protein